MASVEDFVCAPSEALLDQCNRDQLLKIAEHFEISVGDKRLKDNVRAIIKANLYELNVLKPLQESPVVVNLAGANVSQGSLAEPGPELTLSFEQQKELLRLRMQLETGKELEVEKLRQKAEFDKALALEQIRQQTERAKLDLEAVRLNLLKEGKLSDVSVNESTRIGDHSRDIVSSLRLVPRFNEREVEVFFTLFERVADARGWDDADRTVLLQCVLTGRAQEAFSSLSSEDSGTYVKVKTAVLKIYEMVPEAYRQRFRSWKKGDKSCLEFARDLLTHFNRWCSAAEVKDFDGLCNLMVLEQFKNSVPE